MFELQQTKQEIETTKATKPHAHPKKKKKKKKKEKKCGKPLVKSQVDDWHDLNLWFVITGVFPW